MEQLLIAVMAVRRNDDSGYKLAKLKSIFLIGTFETYISVGKCATRKKYFLYYLTTRQL